MTIQDPIADMITRINNAQAVNKPGVAIPFSTSKLAIAKVLQDEGYIDACDTVDIGNNKSELLLKLKYYQGAPVIKKMKRVSKPGLRSYKGVNDLPKVLGGLGVAIISTAKGVMCDREARKKGVGGEVICIVE